MFTVKSRFFGNVGSPAVFHFPAVCGGVVGTVDSVHCAARRCFNAHTHKSIKSDYRLTTGVNSD